MRQKFARGFRRSKATSHTTGTTRQVNGYRDGVHLNDKPESTQMVKIMAWHQKATERAADVLKFAARGALLVNGILLTLASVYVVVKFCWFTLRWLDRVIFSSPW